MPLRWLLILLLVPGLLSAQRDDTQQNFSRRFAALATATGLSDSARLHQLFDLDWEYNNTVYPEFATYTGYPGQNDRWTDLSVAAINRRRGNVKSELTVVHAIDRLQLNAADQLSYDIFKRNVDDVYEGQQCLDSLI